MQVIRESVQESPKGLSLLTKDQAHLDSLTNKVSQLLKSKMIEAITRDDEMSIQKIANLFKSVNE
jgi:hypothetical protein